MIYVIDPQLSAADGEDARAFMAVAREELRVATLSELTSLDNVMEAEPGGADGVVFVNPPRADVATEVEELLERAAEAGAVILPVALDETARRPPGAVGERQSFDIVDHRRRRGLTVDQRGTVARAFAREALGRLQPTYTKDRLRLFLCHRREDGEGLVAKVGTKLDALHPEHVFRDLVDVQVGEEAQQRIDDALAGADVLIFFDTPLAGESWWIAKELAGALGRNIPIVWVRIGPEDQASRVGLPIQPGTPDPHISVCADQLDDDGTRDLADEILETGFSLARTHVRASQSAMRSLRRWARDHDAELETLDARRMVFQLTRSVTDRPYPTRPATDVVQIYARHPTDDDLISLERFLTESDMGPHQRNCRAFDAAVLLDPTATANRAAGEWSVIEHPERFLASLPVSAARVGAGRAPRLLVLGAFPAGDLAPHEVDAAVHAVATTWLRLGGSLLFGGHPTFTPLIIEAARFAAPGTERDRVTVFQSEWFVAPAAVEDLTSQVTVQTTPRAANRAASLTAMRTEMIVPGGADAVVAIGGRTEEGGTHVPGIDEEIGLARAAGMPVYLLGAAGGRAAELAAAAATEAPPFSSLGNELSARENEELATTDDYADATRMLWSASTG